MRPRVTRLLGALVDAKFLFRTRDGAFMRVEHATPVKAWAGHTDLQVPPDVTIFPHLRTARPSAGRKSYL